MSGGFGWNGSNRSSNRRSSRENDAWDAYTPQVSQPSRAVSHSQPSHAVSHQGSQQPSLQMHIWKMARDTKLRSQKATAKNVVIVLVDGTGSMEAWLGEIFSRLSTLFVACQKFLGDDLQILFMKFGDPGCCPQDSIFMADLAGGPILGDWVQELQAIPLQRGGGNRRESAELAALAVDRLVDTSGCKQVFLFTITDEMAEEEVDPVVAHRVGIPSSKREPSQTVYSRLMERMHVFTIFADTSSYGHQHQKVFLPWWKDLLNRPGSVDRVINLDDSRRVVDVMLGAIAAITSQYDTFSQMLAGFQGGTKHGDQNIASVHQSLAGVSKVLSTPVAPAGRVKSLLDL